jgi:hypothetical protein
MVVGCWRWRISVGKDVPDVLLVSIPTFGMIFDISESNTDNVSDKSSLASTVLLCIARVVWRRISESGRKSLCLYSSRTQREMLRGERLTMVVKVFKGRAEIRQNAAIKEQGVHCCQDKAFL